MRPFLSFLLLPLLTLFTLPVFAADNIPQPVKTPGGISGLLLEDTHLPMVTLQFTFPYAGGVSDPAGKEGRAYFGTRMLMEGAGRLSAAEFREQLESLAIDISTSVNEDYLAVTIKTLSEHLPDALRLTGMMLAHPLFDPEAFERVRGQLQVELAESQEDPGWLAEAEWSRIAYGTHAYGTPLQGTKDSLAALRRQDLETWHMQMISRENVAVSAVGDVNRETLAQLLDEALGDLPEKLQGEKTGMAPAIPLHHAPVIVQKDVPQTVAIFGLPSLPRNDPDFYVLYILNHVLGGGTLTSRLSSTIRQQYGLAYAVDTYLSSGLFGPSLQGGFATRNEQAVQAAEVMQNVLHRIASEGVTPEEVENAKQYLIDSFPLSLDSQRARVNYLTSMQLFQLGNDYLQKRNDYFAAVTTKDVNRVAKTLLSDQPLLVLVGTPQGTIDWEHHDIPAKD